MRRRAAAAVAGCLALPAAAQRIELAPSAAVACLTPAAPERAAIDYPLGEWKRGAPGRVKVELTFERADARPSLKTLESEGGSGFVDAVRAGARDWRVPCLRPGESARLVQEFVFKPDDRHANGPDPDDADDALRAERLRCLTHASGERHPEYPTWARRQMVQGNVVAELRFSAPNAAPEIAVHSRPGLRGLADDIAAWSKDYTLPCLQAGESVATTLVFRYVMEGEAWGLKPITLAQLMGSTKDIRRQTLAFDTTTMACPFDVVFDYRRPDGPNRVAVRGSVDPARRPLLKWMETVELDLPRRALDAVYGDRTVVTVPCLRIDLKPKESS